MNLKRVSWFTHIFRLIFGSWCEVIIAQTFQKALFWRRSQTWELCSTNLANCG